MEVTPLAFNHIKLMFQDGTILDVNDGTPHGPLSIRTQRGEARIKIDNGK